MSFAPITGNRVPRGEGIWVGVDEDITFLVIWGTKLQPYLPLFLELENQRQRQYLRSCSAFLLAGVTTRLEASIGAFIRRHFVSPGSVHPYATSKADANPL